MAMTYFGEPGDYSRIIEALNQIFSLVFALEALLKLAALHVKLYFRDDW